jgi:hypothetical protein
MEKECNFLLQTPISMILDFLKSLFKGLHNPLEYLIQNTMDQHRISNQGPSHSYVYTEKSF